MTKRLQSLLIRAKPKLYGPRVIDNLAALFGRLSGEVPIMASVDRLKEDGPRTFAASERQEDAQNYLIELMEQLEEELKREG